MHETCFKVYQLVSLALIASTFAYGAYDYSDLNNFGARITQDVNEQLAPLQNLGYRIRADVQRKLSGLDNLGEQIKQNAYEGLEPVRAMEIKLKRKNEVGDYQNLDNLGAQITQNVNEQLAPLQNLGSRIRADVQRKVSGLENLGEQIQQSVYEGLEPVRAMEIELKMKNGVGGTTIATYLPEGKQFVILNYVPHQCDGTISEEGKCSGSLTPFTINNKKDYCYSSNGYTIVNNQVCIGASSVSVINNEIICRGSTGSPALLTTLDEIKKLCKDSETVKYQYIADPANPKHVKIPNENRYVKCSNNQPGVCIFTNTNGLLNQGGNVIINNY